MLCSAVLFAGRTRQIMGRETIWSEERRARAVAREPSGPRSAYRTPADGGDASWCLKPRSMKEPATPKSAATIESSDENTLRGVKTTRSENVQRPRGAPAIDDESNSLTIFAIGRCEPETRGLTAVFSPG